MNDDEVITAVREQRDKVPSRTSVDQIVRRGRAVRARRFITRGAGALALVAGAAVALTSLTPAGHQPIAKPPAWTVARLTDGSISVRIRQLADPAGLQRALRADGVPATVTLPGHLNRACRPYPASKAVLHMVFLPPPGPAPARTVWVVIDPSALPAGTGARIAVPEFVHFQQVVAGERPPSSALPRPLLDLVHASPACTGS